MTTIQDLPEETFSLIFECLEFHDVLQCQEVCHAWYPTAHIIRLTSVVLSGVKEINRFIAAIDYNPHSTYLGAVKKIWINTLFENNDNRELDINKMFLRFPNLRDVQLRGNQYVTKSFNDQVCNNLIESCPQLETFEVDHYDYGGLLITDLYNVRLLLTILNIDQEVLNKYNGITNVFSAFPRLTKVNIYCDVAFQELLPALEIANHITTLSLEMQKRREDFAERYLMSRTKEQQDQIVEKLAKIKHLTLDGFVDVNTVLFTSKYLVGLQSFKIYDYADNNLLEDDFCNNILDLVCRSKQNGLAATAIGFGSLSRCFPTIMQKAFQYVPFKNTLTICNHDQISLVTVNVNSDKLQLQQKVSLMINSNISVEDVAASLFPESGIANNVDSFSFDCSNTENTSYVMDLDNLNKMFKKMTSLKEIQLDFPSYFVEAASTVDDVYPLVEKVTLESTVSKIVKFQSLLDKFATMFPNIQHLNLYLFSGGKSLVNLKNYTLESLVIDATPSLIEQLNKSEYDFFVVQVENVHEKKTYKILKNSLAATKIDEDDLEGSVLGEDYYSIAITVTNLKRLEIVLSDDEENEQTRRIVLYI